MAVSARGARERVERAVIGKGGEGMDYFIGIVPPDRYKERIEQLQSRWVDKSLILP